MKMPFHRNFTTENLHMQYRPILSIKSYYITIIIRQLSFALTSPIFHPNKQFYQPCVITTIIIIIIRPILSFASTTPIFHPNKTSFYTILPFTIMFNYFSFFSHTKKGNNTICNQTNTKNNNSPSIPKRALARGEVMAARAWGKSELPTSITGFPG